MKEDVSYITVMCIRPNLRPNNVKLSLIERAKEVGYCYRIIITRFQISIREFVKHTGVNSYFNMAASVVRFCTQRNLVFWLCRHWIGL